MFVSPRAKKAAERQGVDASLAAPTGPGGRIIERDIYRLSEQGQTIPAPSEKQATSAADTVAGQSEYTDEKISNVRKVIAKAMHASLSNMAQLTNHTSFDVTKLLKYRKQIKARMDEIGTEDITLNDMILFAVSRVLKNHPSLNAPLFGRYNAPVPYGKPGHCGRYGQGPPGADAVLAPTINLSATYQGKQKDSLKRHSRAILRLICLRTGRLP